ncbi:MAG: C39 family peptidase [Clostridiales bacterium]|nr:C39 family peptidase [Clostridiales bacterium]
MGKYKMMRSKFSRVFVIVLSIFLVIGVVFTAYAGRAYHIKTKGVYLKPSQDFEIHDVQHFLQNDPEWGSDLIGNSMSSLAGAGCLVACAASAATDLGIPVTPGEFNAKMTAVSGYQGNMLIWHRIKDALPGIDYKYTRIPSSTTIEKDLKSGRLPIINVKYMGSGVTHWVLVVGAKDGEFLVYDPLNIDKEPIALSTHGKVFAYRVLVRES